ncbi:hypothetical protein [Halorarum halobium]|uniref:hypothetical protein n=1 Tax=Halorarum halobium TaxID=3075121 RepID=UPI0028AE6127|nr:hypothetical protein [Halobaculum sp. XH14]
MLVNALVEPGKHHHNRSNHLIFVLLKAEKHGLNRIEPEPYTCDCGTTLTPEVLDRGDESKASWPNCKSWSNGGKKKCPECDEYPSIDREQHIRARGYEPTPKSEIKSVTQSQREAALEKTDHTCVTCSSKAEYVKRMVPPRYGGSRDMVNLAPLCNEHYEDYGHMFVDVLYPEGWYQIHHLDWEEYVEALRDKYSSSNERLTEILDSLLEKGQPENPYPYID